MRDVEVQGGHRLSLSERAERILATLNREKQKKKKSRTEEEENEEEGIQWDGPPFMRPKTAPLVLITGRSLPRDIPGMKRVSPPISILPFKTVGIEPRWRRHLSKLGLYRF